MPDLMSYKQKQFIAESTAKWNIAHGAVRTGKTICCTFRFLEAAIQCPDSKIFIIGHTVDTAYHNIIRLIMEDPALSLFTPYCCWFPAKRELKIRDKTIKVLGAKDEGAIGSIQGKTFSVCYCDEMTLFPESLIDMIDSRLSNPYSIGFASMNPSHPTHKIKKWIDKAEEGDKNYYALHFTLEDNPFVNKEYKERIKESMSGLSYKRNYLGLWCLAEGAIFDFFDTDIHVIDRPPMTAEYWVAGIDYGTSNNFACVLMGVNTGRFTQTGVHRWIEKEYVWDSHKKGRQKTNAEYADDLEEFLDMYAIRAVYIDPSAASFKAELRKRGIHTIDADNDVIPGLTYMTSEMARGALKICKDCPVLIKELEGYWWDPYAAKKGEDRPLR